MPFRLPLLAAILALAAATSAQAHVSHLVVQGETLSGIAAANGLTTQALAAANGLSPQAFVISGRTLSIPPRGIVPVASTGAAVEPATAPAPLNGYRVRLGDSLSKIAAEHGVSLSRLAAENGLNADGVLVAGTSLRLPGGGAVTSAAPATTATTSSGGGGAGHDVVPGETLTGIAAANGVTPAALAAANGLSPNSFVIAGTTLKIPAGTPAASVPAATPAVTGPVATGTRMTAQQIGSIAGANGAPASLATAIAWQESGFNNNMVSVANARGIMQVIPSTWDYVQRHLAGGPLDPASASDNVRAGSLLLARLLRDTGDPATAVAAYYQGLGSVRRIGMLPETRRYVANVMALRARFGG
jgi:LysM repeat protein